jgi:hypothetical protein
VVATDRCPRRRRRGGDAIVVALAAWSGLSGAPTVEPSPTGVVDTTPTPAATDANTVSNPEEGTGDPAAPKDNGNG